VNLKSEDVEEIELSIQRSITVPHISVFSLKEVGRFGPSLLGLRKPLKSDLKPLNTIIGDTSKTRSSWIFPATHEVMLSAYDDLKKKLIEANEYERKSFELFKLSNSLHEIGKEKEFETGHLWTARREWQCFEGGFLEHS
jgi:hypothetical protein